jgi:diguanylate cyclase (GGDEF)-like protein/PAS domain S-box-containing protein
MPSLERIAHAVAKTWRLLTGETETTRQTLARVFEDNFDGLVVVDEVGRIVAASRVAANMLLGQGNGDLVGRMAAEVVPEAMTRAIQQAFTDGRRTIPTPMAVALIGDPRDGGFVVQYVVNLSELGEAGEMSRRVVSLTFWDETERRRREEELAFMGTHDQLTGALTKSELIRIINATLTGERRRATGLTMLVIDLNRFKAVNDALGQSRGDMLLKQLVSRLKAAGLDTVARLGGASFTVIRNGRMPADELQRLSQNVLERVVLPYIVGGQRAIIGASIGITDTEVSGYDPEVLLGHADAALNAAKALPGNAFVIFTPEMDRRLKDQQALDVALRQARERNELSITYQPQCSLETGELVGVEALVRWTNPELGVVSPDAFIPVAEENGEIIEIGRWVLNEACREVVAWPFQTRVAVNVSPVQFEFSDIVAEVREALNASGLPAHRLDIEITEGILVSKAEHIIEALNKLRALGVGIALDDFGTGYSSLSYLGRLPVDKIKIDQTFVSRLPADPESGAIIRAVMTLSDTLNKIVIAEGVENKDQAWMLRMMGCRIGQGYHFSRPQTGVEMSTWFEAANGSRSRASKSAVGSPSPFRSS